MFSKTKGGVWGEEGGSRLSGDLFRVNRLSGS